MPTQWLRRFSGPSSRRPSRRTSSLRVQRLRVETLEGRIAPATLVAAYGSTRGPARPSRMRRGTGNNGTIANATWTTAGKYGNALVFNGTQHPGDDQ